MRTHVIELVKDKPKKKSKSIALIRKQKKSNYKDLQAKEDSEESELDD